MTAEETDLQTFVGVVQRPDVVADGAEGGAEPLRELARGRGALLQERQDPHPEWMAERLDIARIVDVGDRFRHETVPEGTPIHLRQS